MPFSNIDKPSKYFNTLTYTGDAVSPRTVTGVGFKPDFTWIKNRTRAGSSALNDNVRGAGLNKELSSETTNAEGNNGGSGYGYISAFASDGFTLTTGSTAYDIVNRSGDSYVSWNWLASNTTASNTSGSITSTVSVNTTSGFSIVSYAGTGTTATVGHGLGVAPKMIIVKNRNASPAESWAVYHSTLGTNKYLLLNTSDASATSTGMWNNTAPTSTVFSLYNEEKTNKVSTNLIAYCFAEVKGFSKFGSYTGNGSADGTFVYTGFKPAFILRKASSTTGYWNLHDNKRDTYNLSYLRLFPDLNGSEATSTDNSLDILSNGFKCRATNTDTNGSGSTYIYMAFAENPFVSSKGLPTTARWFGLS